MLFLGYGRITEEMFTRRNLSELLGREGERRAAYVGWDGLRVSKGNSLLLCFSTSSGTHYLLAQTNIETLKLKTPERPLATDSNPAHMQSLLKEDGSNYICCFLAIPFTPSA